MAIWRARKLPSRNRVALVLAVLAFPSVFGACFFSHWREQPVAGARGRSSAGSAGAASLHALQFERNVGQTAPEVAYLARGPRGTVFLMTSGALLTVAGGPGFEPPWLPNPRPARGAGTIVRMTPLGARGLPDPVGVDLQPGKSHYLLGNDFRRWRTNVPRYAKVRFASIYPGIDLAYSPIGGRTKYDFIVAPGAEPRRIELAFDVLSGSWRRLPPHIDTEGNLVLDTGAGTMVQRAPVVYQDLNGLRHPVAARYEVRETGVGFQLGAYDPSRILIIDPALEYATYVGVSLDDSGSGIAVDADGNAYIVGRTGSADFPTRDPFNGYSAGDDVFVMKFDAAGIPVYSTYLGGSGDDLGDAIAVDAAGNAYVVGATDSPDFPTTPGALQTAYAAGDVFVTKLDATGSTLLYSTYFGGNGGETGRFIALDVDGNAYVTGSTSSPDLPLVNAWQGAHGGGLFDAFVAKIDPTGSTLLYATYFGGSRDDLARGIAVDRERNAYITGATESPDLATTRTAFQRNRRGTGDAFVAKLGSAGDDLLYSTYLGGSAGDGATAIALDDDENAYLAGSTNSLDFPVANGFQPAYGGGLSDAFVAKLDTFGESLLYSTYLGGRGAIGSIFGGDGATAIALDSTGNAYVTGATDSPDFPIRDGMQSAHGGGFDAYVAKVGPAGDDLLNSSYLGGSGDDEGRGIALDTQGNVYLIGDTRSTNFPTIRPFQALPSGTPDAFLAKLSLTQTAQLCAYVLQEPSPTNNPLSGTISVIDVTRKAVTGVLPVAFITDHLAGIAVSPGGRFAYVANAGTVFFPVAMRGDSRSASEREGGVLVIDTSTHAVVNRISIPAASAVAITPDGSKAYVTDDKDLYSVDTVTSNVTVIPVGGSLRQIAITPDGSRAYATDVGDRVWIISVSTDQVIGSITLPVRSQADGLAITPDGTRAYVALYARRSLALIDISTDRLVASLPTTPFPAHVAVTPSGAFAYVTHAGRAAGSVSVIDTRTDRVVSTIALDKGVGDVAISPDGAFAYGTSGGGDIAVIDTSTHTVITTIPVGGSLGRIALASMPNGCVVPSGCTGDCGNDRSVSVAELLALVNIALGTTSVSECRAGDANRDALITIDELLVAVNKALSGCE